MNGFVRAADAIAYDAAQAQLRPARPVTQPRRLAPKLLTDPHAIAEFGDPAQYVLEDGSIDGRWPASILAEIELPAPLRLSWERAEPASRLRVHRKLVAVFARALATIHADPGRPKRALATRGVPMRGGRSGARSDCPGTAGRSPSTWTSQTIPWGAKARCTRW